MAQLTQPSTDSKFLAGIPVFGGLPDDVLSTLAARAAIRRIDGPTEILTEGTTAAEMFIVREGELEVRKRNSRGGEILVATLRCGDCVGEMSLIDIQPRSATVRSKGAAILLTLTHLDLADLARATPEAHTLLVMNIAREISRRLRRADELLVEMALPIQDLWGKD